MSSSAGVPAIANLVAAGKVDPKVLQTYPFDQAPRAQRAVESGHALGRIAIDLEQTTEVWTPNKLSTTARTRIG